MWYAGLTDGEFVLLENHTFIGWRRTTVKHADKPFGAKGKAFLEKAWKEVGL